MTVERGILADALASFAAIIDASPLPTSVLDRAGSVRLWNVAAQQVLGWTADEAIGRPPPSIPEDQRSTFERQFQQALRGDTVTGVESRCLTRDGSLLEVRVAAAPLRNNSGVIVGVVRTVEDVSERKRAEDALRESEQRFRTIVSTANEGIWLVDLDARTRYTNDRMAAMLGYSPEELQRRTVLDCLFPGDEPLAQERIEQNVQGNVEQFDFRFRRRDGSELLVLGLLAREQRARAEAQRLAAERSIILSQMADGVVIVDAAGEIIFRNEAAQRISGDGKSTTSLADAIQDFGLTTLEGDPYRLNQLPIMRALHDREPVTDAQWRARRPDGSEVILQGTAAPLIGENGELLGAVSTFRDVTAQRTLEQQKDDFLSAVAHDLKTPLTSLKGHAQLLQRRITLGKVTDHDQLLEGLGRIEQNAARMTSLISELMDLTHLQMGQGLELNLRQLDIVSLVRRCVDEYRDDADGRITVRSNLPELLGRWDEDRVGRVISNLLSNAVKYSAEDTSIEVTVRERMDNGRRYAAVSVQDLGIGIPSHDVPHIFERFHRGQNVGRETTGTGIGLAGARQIVEQHGGTIALETEEGVGSTFTVYLPLGSVSS